MTTALEIVRASNPGCTEEFAGYILWDRTPCMMRDVDAQELHKFASGYARARKRGVSLCDMCERVVTDQGGLCINCAKAMARP